VSNKVLEVDQLPEQSLEHLKEASLQKKKRGLKNIIQRQERQMTFSILRAIPKS